MTRLFTHSIKVGFALLLIVMALSSAYTKTANASPLTNFSLSLSFPWTGPSQKPPLPAPAHKKSGVSAKADHFINSVYPHAVKAAKLLGVDPNILVAQAAHETAWGKYLPKHKDGRTSYNLFGIKATKGQPHVVTSTKEFVNGKYRREQARFRAYSNYGECFEDYARFVQRKRFQPALKYSHDPYLYIKQLQKHGYATDPHYAEKVYSIYKNKILRTV